MVCKLGFNIFLVINGFFWLIILVLININWFLFLFDLLKNNCGVLGILFFVWNLSLLYILVL